MKKPMKKWTVRDAVGREYEVTIAAVRRDYVNAIMQMDGLTEKQAQEYVDKASADGDKWEDYWFPEQMADSLKTIQSVGVLLKDVTDEQKNRCVEVVAGMGNTEIISEKKP